MKWKKAHHVHEKVGIIRLSFFYIILYNRKGQRYAVCLIMWENLMLSTPFLQMFQGLRAFALPFRPLEKAVLRGAARVVIAGRFAASPHPEARTIQRPGKRV